MRKFIALCFVTATLLASSARAQSIFIDKGDPSAVSASLAGGKFKEAWGAGLSAGYTYRGVFDVGVEFLRLAYTAGDNNKLAGYSIAPYATWHLFRHDVDELPVSISATFAMQRIIYTGNGPVANPEAWGLVAGGSAYRRFDFGSLITVVPELFVGFDMAYQRLYSAAQDQNSGNRGSLVDYREKATYGVRALARPNVAIHVGNANYIVAPYVGYEGVLGFAVGANVGALF